MITPEVDDAAVAEYFALGTVSGSRTLFRGVKKLEPGHTLTWKDGRVWPASAQVVSAVASV